MGNMQNMPFRLMCPWSQQNKPPRIRPYPDIRSYAQTMSKTVVRENIVQYK